MKIYLPTHNLVVDTNEEPAVVKLSDTEKGHISNMLPEAHHYASGPENCTSDELHSFLQDAQKKFEIEI